MAPHHSHRPAARYSRMNRRRRPSRLGSAWPCQERLAYPHRSTGAGGFAATAPPQSGSFIIANPSSNLWLSDVTDVSSVGTSIRFTILVLACYNRLPRPSTPYCQRTNGKMVPPLPVGLVGSINKITVLGGDTIHANFQEENVRIRLFGIDAPEAGQSFGDLSERNLRLHLADPVVMEVMQSQDRYGRVVGLIYRPSDSRWNSINLRMVRDGLAYAYVPTSTLVMTNRKVPLNFTSWTISAKGWSVRNSTPFATRVVSGELAPQAAKNHGIAATLTR